MTPKLSDAVDRDIRTQGLVGVTLLLVTLVMFVYRTGSTDGQSHQSIAETARVALETAQSDLQGLFDGKGPERNIALLKNRAMFGWDFVPAWMIFIVFLQREIVKYRPGERRALLFAFFILIVTVAVNASLNGFISTAERQTVTDAELNRIVFFGQVKWMFLFFDAFLAGVYLYHTPPILRVGAVILGAASVVGFGSTAVPTGLLVPYCVLGIFLAFSGICTLLLFHPQLLYGKWKLPSPPAQE